MSQSALPGSPSADRPLRPAGEGIVPTKRGRDRLLRAVRRHVRSFPAVPPLSLEELRARAEKVRSALGLEERYAEFIAVLVSNEVWRDALAAVPFDRRLLLLPQCLRDVERCRAGLDEMGLLCKGCGRCQVHEFQTAAEALGYVVLIAEGSPAVISLVETGKIEAVIGVSCLASLEKIFPYVEAAAVPGIAIPLLQDGCAFTSVDADWVWDAIYATSRDRTGRLDLDRLRDQVETWFTPESLREVLGAGEGQTEGIARAWLAKSGKRWRPFLSVCASQALRRDPEGPIGEDLRDVAVAVECFHKASLIHDDIEDRDQFRYGEKTLHEQHGVPVALNVGDLLLGEGYRLIAHCGVPAETAAEMLRVAADGHRRLCIGQGAELCWGRRAVPLTPPQVIDIFRRKTAPAFDVALQLGAIYAGAGQTVRKVLLEYSDALGVAYQVRDDLEDFASGGAAGDVAAMRPSLLLALAYQGATGDAKALLDAVWRRHVPYESVAPKVEKVLGELGAAAAARRMLAAHKERAIASLRGLDNSALKGLLRRVIARIFNDIENAGSDNGHAASDASGGRVRAGPVG